MEQVQLWIFADDPGRVRAFYKTVFGWSLADDGPRRCWLVTNHDDPRLGTDGPAGRRPEHLGEVAVPTVHVADLDAATTAALAAGGEILVPRITLPGAGRLAYLADTEGNVIGIMQDDDAPPHVPTIGKASPDLNSPSAPEGEAAR